MVTCCVYFDNAFAVTVYSDMFCQGGWIDIGKDQETTI